MLLTKDAMYLLSSWEIGVGCGEGNGKEESKNTLNR